MRGRLRRSCLAVAAALVVGGVVRPVVAADRLPAGKPPTAAQLARQREQFAAINAGRAKPSVEAAKEMLRLGLRSKNVDPMVRTAAIEALRDMAGDPEIARHLLQAIELEWQRGNTEHVTALALALLPVAGDELPQGIVSGIERRLAASPQASTVVAGIVAAAVRQRDATGVATLARIAELSRFRSDFAFRRGLVGSLIGIQRPEAVAALIRLLASLQGEARMDVVRYLTAVSGQRHGADVEAWSRWWREAGETFEFLDRPVLPAHAEVAAGETGSYYDIPLYAQSLVFVIDTSLSMEGPRLAAAQRELIEAIEGLPPTTRFNVIGFGSRAYAWQPRLVAAEPAAKEAAGSFVGQLVADGQTATFDAIETAFQFDVEAVFLLSDGEPTAGKVVDPVAIARFVGAANEARRMSVYTIGVLPEPELAAFLRGLADQNFGCYLQVDQ